MKPDRPVRSLAQLERSGSTARMLNLNAIAKRGPRPPETESRPLFHNALLNRSMVVKHRLRRGELELFPDYRLQATKFVLPTDASDLKAGGRYFFVGQRGYEDTISDLLGSQSRFNAHDRMVLQILDQSPTLDPFVLREQLRRHGLEPSPHYFEIGAADLSRMQAFVAKEIAPLANLTTQSVGGEAAAKLARKLLSSKAEMETEPLRHTLKLDVGDYSEGVFCWKGFLYYKWCLDELTAHIAEVAQDITRTRLRAGARAQLRAQVEQQRARLHLCLAAAYDSVKATIGIYDEAYCRLVQDRDPAPFRQFLLRAPSLFNRVGEGLGAIQHVVSYWRFRFPPASHAAVEAADLQEILEDFLQALSAFDTKDAEEAQGQRRAPDRAAFI
jgi:hypothetical protein